MEYYGAVTPQHSSLKHYFTAIHGDKAAGMPLGEGTARSDVESKYGGTPAHFDKLKIRQGWAAGTPLVVGKAEGLGVVGWRYSAAQRQAAKPAGTPIWQQRKG